MGTPMRQVQREKSMDEIGLLSMIISMVKLAFGVDSLLAILHLVFIIINAIYSICLIPIS